MFDREHRGPKCEDESSGDRIADWLGMASAACQSRHEEPVNAEVTLLLWWAAFAGSHMGLSSVRVRPRLVAAMGPGAYAGLYSLVALATFVPLVSVYMSHRHDGAELWNLRHVPGLLGASMWLSGACFAFSVASFFQPSPAGMGASGTARARGLTRITRHPLFVPIAFLGLSHAAINGFATDVIFFGGLFVYGIVGCMHQDARKRATEDDAFRAFLDETSLLPFAAILRGRTRLVWTELPWAGMAVGIAAAIGFYRLHAWMFA